MEPSHRRTVHQIGAYLSDGTERSEYDKLLAAWGTITAGMNAETTIVPDTASRNAYLVLTRNRRDAQTIEMALPEIRRRITDSTGTTPRVRIVVRLDGRVPRGT